MQHWNVENCSALAILLPLMFVFIGVCGLGSFWQFIFNLRTIHAYKTRAESRNVVWVLDTGRPRILPSHCVGKNLIIRCHPNGFRLQAIDDSK